MEAHDGQVKYILVRPTKSIAGVIILTLLLGPIGLLYASFWGGTIMFVILLVCGLIPRLGALFVVIGWAVCCFWGVWAVNRYNDKIFSFLSKDK